jgi:putative endonuclease
MSTGSGRHHGGLAAEEIAARIYLAEGAALVARRWRCPEGEIDLIVRWPGLVVFVEVKARGAAADAAAHAIAQRQWARVGAAASHWLAENTDGTLPCRFDAVIVDRSGRAVRHENAASFDGW